MIVSAKFRRLRDAVETLRQAGVVPTVADSLARFADDTAELLYQTVSNEVPAYTESGNPTVLPELREHLGQHATEICRVLRGDSAPDLGFLKEHAERRAEQRFPLDAMLQAYRAMHRVFSVWIRDTALAVASKDAHMTRVVAAVTEFSIEYTGAVSTTVTSEYVRQTRALAEAEGDRRTELLQALLQGYDESDRRVAQLLRRAGYLQQRQSYCVLVAQSVEPREMEHAARTQRIVDAVAREMSGTSLRSISGLHDNLVTFVVSGTRRSSGWTAPQTKLADRVEKLMLKLGPAVLIGLSSDQPSTSFVPRALNEAQIALEFASVTERVVQYAHIPIRRLLVHLGGDQVKSALPAWTDNFVNADKRAKGKLRKTLRAYADADMNVLRAARELDIHPNTIYARMNRITDVTGLDAQRFDALTELLLAAELSG